MNSLGIRLNVRIVGETNVINWTQVHKQILLYLISDNRSVLI